MPVYPIANASLNAEPCQTVSGEVESTLRGLTVDQMVEFHCKIYNDLEIAQERFAASRNYIEGCAKRLEREIQLRPESLPMR